MEPPHKPVLLQDVVRILRPAPGETYLDGTAGYGGHAAAVQERIGASGRMILVDRDPEAIKALERRFKDQTEIRHARFSDAARELAAEGVAVDMILLDLGVSSPQFDNPERGFSFKADAPLDMRMDTTQPRTAAEIVNTTREPELSRLIREYGEEPRARAVARAVVAARPITSTAQLAQVVRRFAADSGDIDRATRTFQAIRMAVNQELDEIAKALPLMVQLLRTSGRMAVISFHSLEDRMVKQFIDKETRDCICPPKQPICTCGHVASLKKLTFKPIVAGSDEIAINPRARSAKLRAAEKINKNK